MPILWRYLLRSYFQVLTLCVSGFIGVLLILRLQEIARFATSGAGFLKVFLFALYQIPYILPIAIPISCLIAALLLLQRLSHTQELTAFRACGVGISLLTTPLYIAGVFLTLLNFTISSEVAPRCRALSKILIYEIAMANPFFMLQKESLIKVKNAYMDIEVLKAGKYAENVLLVFKNSSSERLALLTAKELSLTEDLLKGKQVTVISSAPLKSDLGFDHLIIENQAEMDTQASNLFHILRSGDWSSSNYDYLTLRSLLAKEALSSHKASYGMSLGKGAVLELAKRLSIGLAAFTFTYIGIAFGMEISRTRRKRGLVFAIALTSTFLICFMTAKSFRSVPLVASAIYLLPHPLLLICAFRFSRSLQKGVE